MTTTYWLLAFILSSSTLAYHRASLSVWTFGLALFLIFFATLADASSSFIITTWICFLIIFIPLFCTSIRRRYISKPFFNLYRKIMPIMSRTEEEALRAGTVGWEGDLFCGQPEWNKLLAYPLPKLTAEEVAFINGPVEVLCSMIDDWDITHNRADFPVFMWEFLKKEGFFALLIPKEYGGKGFSNCAISQVCIKIQGCSVTVGTTVSVPNSLGPAELLLHYGTPEQKSYYLPRLANGNEIPCFALTSPDAGSDATSMTDSGIICQGKFAGKQVLGIRLNWNKRYITLAPIATVIGLAFKLYDPDHLLGDKDELGITCALIPRQSPGITIGRRHFPMSTPFQNGPIQGKDVFIPLDWIIGGPGMIGQGWRMLMECLAGGRAVSLPAIVTGAAKAAVLTSGAYARVRKQFKQSIARFEGVAEVLASMASKLYIMDAARLFALGAVDAGEKPAVASAIVKYHLTERARAIGSDAMDIHGGKGIMLGPKNYLGRGYESVPIAITVEGANILTRNLIIFGQGAIRCHPYLLTEYEAAQQTDQDKGLTIFDKALFAHIGFAFSNMVRTCWLGLTSSRIAVVPQSVYSRYLQSATRFSSAFALFTDILMLVYSGNIKRKESVSARLGDILSNLYLLSAALNRFEQDKQPAEELPLVHTSCQTCLYEIQQSFTELLQNLPSKILSVLLRFILFPMGQHFSKPKVELTNQVAQLFVAPTETRRRLTGDVYLTPGPNNNLAQLEDALLKCIAAEPVEKLIRKATPGGAVNGRTLKDLAKAAMEQGVITFEQYDIYMQAEDARQAVIAVDDFSPEELMRT